MDSQLAAILIMLILIGLGIFQILLILGFPYGNYAWGGKYKVLPGKLRIASSFSLVIYAFIIIILLNNAGLINIPFLNQIDSPTSWIICIYFILGILLNGISRSRKEKLVMTPIALILAVLSFVVANAS